MLVVATSKWLRVNTDLEHMNEQATNFRRYDSGHIGTRAQRRQTAITLGCTRPGSPSIAVQAVKVVTWT
jgi:hypothetical protein